MQPPTPLDELLHQDRLHTVFQPIVSLKRKAVFAYEALTRCTDPQSGQSISPQTLFAMAPDVHARLELDRACRNKALQSFACLHGGNRSMMLSLNMDVSCLTCHTRGSGCLLKAVKRLGISPSNVIIEIIESKAADMDVLLDFVEFYRHKNFLIALDDVGAGYSNLDRIPMIKPDVLKMDRSLVAGIDRHFHKLEVAKSFVQLAGRIGALVVAEGVETQDEALCLLENGVDVFQGYYFARPGDPAQDFPDIEKRVEGLAALFKERATERINRDKHRLSQYDALMLTLGMELAAGEGGLDHDLIRYLEAHPRIECLYVLDMRGIQISRTICNPLKLRKSKRLLYEPAEQGTDHSLKEYYLPLRAGLEKFTTTPYISLASGNRCITISHVFHHRKMGRDLILCADISHGSEPDNPS